MFQYTKENILNDVAGVDVVANISNPYTGAATKKLVIKGVGEYYLDSVVGEIVKTVGEKGSPASVTITLPADGEHVLTFRVVTSKALAEFASPNWNIFGKPMIIGYNGGVTAAVEAVKLAIPEGNEFIKVEAEGNKLKLTGVTNYITFDKIAIDDVAVTDKVTANVEPFATKEWIIENLRFPTYSNIRYNSAGNMPTAELYAEYSFVYKMPRTGLGGLSGVGQAVDAVTRHILYVPVTSPDGTTGLDAKLANFKATGEPTEPDIDPAE